MLDKLRAFLRQPFPFRMPVLRILAVDAMAGLFVSTFLWIFKPFGSIIYIQEGRSWILWGYGIVTFLVLTADLIGGPAVFPGFFDEAKWNLFRAIGFQFWHIVSIGTANLFFAALVGRQEIRLWAIFIYILQALAVGFFPLTLGMFSIQFYLLKKYAESTRRMNKSLLASRTQTVPAPDIPPTAVVTAETGKDRIEIPLRNLLLIRSVDNYVEIYASGKGGIRKTLLRSSLRRIGQELKDHPRLFKCHRAFLVNLDRISHVTGNSQGYKLVFEGIAFAVPVSRNTSKSLFQKITRPRAGRPSPGIV